ncbi:hypothetical protein KY284_023215 [Solanum tuberosum]|nr:hypothetical protein KY284_023215 [Solanum tuberosum]
MKKKYQGNARAKLAQLQTVRAGRVGASVLLMHYDNCQQDADSLRERLEDVIIVEKIMRYMLPKFNFVIYSIEESKVLDTLSLDELQISLMVHEQKIVQHDVEEQKLQVTTTSKDSERRRSKWKGRNLEKTEEEITKRMVSIIVINDTHPMGSQDVTKEKEDSLLMVSQSLEEYHKSVWYLDMVCSNHLSGEKSAFSELDETFRRTVKFGDLHALLSKGKRSVGQLQENGYEIFVKIMLLESNLAIAFQKKKHGELKDS